MNLVYACLELQCLSFGGDSVPEETKSVLKSFTLTHFKHACFVDVPRRSARRSAPASMRIVGQCDLSEDEEFPEIYPEEPPWLVDNAIERESVVYDSDHD